jgi:3-phenylpropionate/trans-cinnamate dioxygenase ferredoxin component
MSDWVDVVKATAIADGEHVTVDVDGVEIAVFKLEGQFYAIEDVCTHDGAQIADGMLEGDEIICPRHGARFCIKTGAVKSPPAYEDITCYPVRIESGIVQVKES